MTSPAKLPDTRAFQRIVEYVERALAAGELKAGDRLPSERELVERFGMGRSSVREALRVLENMELVRSAPRDPRGPLVLEYSVGPVRRSLAVLTSARTVTLPELVQFRMIVDASANLMAAARRTDEQLLALERNMARMRESMGIGYAEFSRADLEFHEIIAEAGGNKLVQVYGGVIREAVLGLIQRTILDADDRTALMLASIRHHGAVFAAIAARDGARASRLARETLYAYYADHVEPADRAIMADLVRECGGRVPV
ncbi:MAG: GntR family transcriptional regulator, transcriptional repressor for pyruvate dehydrogenase complex [Pseudonocardiales bacterium]|jgi:GntR family transcriptional repressor for pyruvate dehydrogenase complex|nr:GntR family transcriptional regulator, transcriptional repressor for pyruvate dehydrogenase complex [Pseudonocardiales bacterium]MDT7610383.1 GntR family transcriptional regulator, transcriptional repressor for pyruvate dehydrogenase complex [Pseudonocardiales bacterium]MDT7624904.1 GntR family transcriptional regulator, transcriptional repressor for pyruvate dehydrogenase complex [Pseudonocardiales bacterium]